MDTPFLKKMIKDLSIFYDTFNQRPVSHTNKIPELYYSEKLITKNQLQDYENSCKELRDFFNEYEKNYLQEKEPETKPASGSIRNA